MATSYGNVGGSGWRYSVINVTTTLSTNGSITYLVGGGYGNGMFFNNQSVAGLYILFDFRGVYGVGPQSIVIDEATWYQSVAGGPQGTWQWQGSNDNSTWTNIGATFTLGGTTVQTHTTLNGNTTAYTYYRLLGVSGSSNSGPYEQGVNFRIDGWQLLVPAIPQTQATPIQSANITPVWQTLVTPITSNAFSDVYGSTGISMYQQEHYTVPYPYGNIAPGNPVPVGTTLGTGTVNIAYTETITVQGGVPPYAFSIIAGTLPSGLVLNANGNITGTPTAVTTSVFTLQVTDSVTDTGSQQYTLQVQNASSGNVGGNYGWTK